MQQKGNGMKVFAWFMDEAYAEVGDQRIEIMGIGEGEKQGLNHFFI